MLHASQTYLPSLIEIKHWLWIRVVRVLRARGTAISSDPTPPFLLVCNGCFPGLVYVLFVKLSQFGTISSDKGAFWIPLLPERNRRVAAVELSEKCRAGEPHPVSHVAGNFVYGPFVSSRRNRLDDEDSRSINNSSKTSAPRSHDT